MNVRGPTSTPPTLEYELAEPLRLFISSNIPNAKPCQPFAIIFYSQVLFVHLLTFRANYSIYTVAAYPLLSAFPLTVAHCVLW